MKTLFEIGNKKRQAIIHRRGGGVITLLFTGESKHDGEYFDLTKSELPKAKTSAKRFVKTGIVRW